MKSPTLSRIQKVAVLRAKSLKFYFPLIVDEIIDIIPHTKSQLF